MFLIKVAVKYGDSLVDANRVWQLTTSLVQQFRSLPTGRWHLANLMAPGLERMAAMLGRGKDAGQQNAQSRPMLNGAGDLTDPTLMADGANANGMVTGAPGELFFDYGMSFGLSPVFQFDPTSFMGGTAGSDPGMQDFGPVDYQLHRPNT
jgi:hypothetical protein